MKKLLLALGFVASIAQATPTTVIGKHGEVYRTGYLGLRRTDSFERSDFYWSPTIAEVADLPASFDSRALGAVAPIKNQGNCGSCWDFSMTKTFESARLSAGKTYLDLSEQDMLVNDSSAYGCSGGFMDADYIVKHGLALETDCPYTANDNGRCSAAPADKAIKWGMVGAPGRSPTEGELRAAIVKYHVLSVTVAAGGSDWSNPPGGKQTRCRTRGINHMVNLVGYDCPLVGKCTFTVANSWGSSWGDHGFAYAKQGCNELASTTDSALWIQYLPDAK